MAAKGDSSAGGGKESMSTRESEERMRECRLPALPKSGVDMSKSREEASKSSKDPKMFTFSVEEAEVGTSESDANR